MFARLCLFRHPGWLAFFFSSINAVEYYAVLENYVEGPLFLAVRELG